MSLTDYDCNLLNYSPHSTRWEGDNEGVTTTWLRWADAEGHILPTRCEMAQQAQQEAQQAKLEAQQAQTEKQKLAAKLRAMGIDPEALSK